MDFLENFDRADDIDSLDDDVTTKAIHLMQRLNTMDMNKILCMLRIIVLTRNYLK